MSIRYFAEQQDALILILTQTNHSANRLYLLYFARYKLVLHFRSMHEIISLYEAAKNLGHIHHYMLFGNYLFLPSRRALYFFVISNSLVQGLATSTITKVFLTEVRVTETCSPRVSLIQRVEGQRNNGRLSSCYCGRRSSESEHVLLIPSNKIPFIPNVFAATKLTIV